MTEKNLVLKVLIFVIVLKSNNGHSSYVNTGMWSLYCLTVSITI